MLKKFFLLPLLLVVAGVLFSLSKGNFLKTPCPNSLSCAYDLSGVYEKDTVGEYMGQKVFPPKEDPQPYLASILGVETVTNKRIQVDLSTQTLTAYEGSRLAYFFPVSTGKWGRTPTGEFKIWIKLRYTRMRGGSKYLGTYYDLPNVPYTMFYYNNQYSKAQGYSVHGAYWHNNFGFPMSHGCINMRIEDAGVLFNWAEVGTPVVVTGITPKS